MLPRYAIATILVTALFTVSSAAQQACPCVPVTHVWIASGCESWTCVETEMALANGSTIVPMPTSSTDFPWIVLKRVASGSATVSPDAPFLVDGFDALADGVAKYVAMSRELQPVLLTTPDGKTLVVARNPSTLPRKRVVGH